MVSGTRTRKYLWLGWFLGVLASMSCGPVGPYCTTTAGLELHGMWETGSFVNNFAYSCDAIQLVEDRVAAKAAFIPGMDMKRLRGQKLFVHETASWPDPWRRGEVSGLTTCWTKTVEIGWTTIDIRYTALAHELFHVAQDCAISDNFDPGLDTDHFNWNRDGVYKAIMEINAIP